MRLSPNGVVGFRPAMHGGTKTLLQSKLGSGGLPKISAMFLSQLESATWDCGIVLQGNDPNAHCE